jgi:16S rRNA (guanine527-N7)-methyltransferase
LPHFEGVTEPDPGATFDELLVGGVARLSISLGAREIAAFRAYGEELLRWSPRMNLTGFGTPEQIVRYGFLDSLACASLLPPNAERVLDVGSGAGFPAIPLAIVHPRVGFTLVEPSRKKTTFLRHVVRALKLSKVQVLSIRVEDLQNDRAMLRSFDAASARAVAPPANISEWVRPFLRAGGVFLAQVGSGERPAETPDLLCGRGFELAGEANVPVEFGKPGRRIIALRKTAVENG